MTGQAQTLISELDGVLSGVSRARRLAMLKQVTDLFLAYAAACTSEQIAVFDAVIKRLARDVGPRPLAELSSRLAALEGAPAGTVAQLANSDDIAVSGPLLEKSPALTDDDLVGIARAKGQHHLMAIAGRARLAHAVSDVLLDRGDTAVKRKVVENPGAEISELGFARAVSAAGHDRNLAKVVAARADVPPELRPFLEAALGQASPAAAAERA